MALIITLNRELEPATDAPVEDHASRRRSGEIVLFPGVRYERWDNDAQPDGTRQSAQRDRSNGSPVRDWLEI